MLEGWPSGLRRRPAKALDASPRGFESHSLRFGLYGLLIFGPVAPRSAAQVAVDGWPSGLRRMIGNHVG